MRIKVKENCGLRSTISNLNFGIDSGMINDKYMSPIFWSIIMKYTEYSFDDINDRYKNNYNIKKTGRK